jgi:hypothetical protein
MKIVYNGQDTKPINKFKGGREDEKDVGCGFKFMCNDAYREYGFC